MFNNKKQQTYYLREMVVDPPTTCSETNSIRNKKLIIIETLQNHSLTMMINMHLLENTMYIKYLYLLM